MDKTKEYIWYASYGSNLHEERFLCYILGGKPKGAKLVNKGCRDKSLPLQSKQILINQELYFAKESNTWSKGGVAFIGESFDKSVATHGRMYLITKEQFSEVLKQEIKLKSDLNIDFNTIESKGSLVVKEKSWYGKVLFLGKEEDYPIFTFTHPDKPKKPNKPSKEYVTTIINGLQEIYNFNVDALVDYLSCKAGISGNYTPNELRDLINNL